MKEVTQRSVLDSRSSRQDKLKRLFKAGHKIRKFRCAWCGKTSYAFADEQRTCSQVCAAHDREARKRLERTDPPPSRCAHCGAEYRPRWRAGVKHCSRSCSAKAWRARKRAAGGQGEAS